MTPIVPDSEYRRPVSRLPALARDLAMLARFDRPIGWWLLFWPCAWGVWLAGVGLQLPMVAWLLLGSVVMRGAGCVYNDILDARLDAQVERTASRPLAAGRVSRRAAWLWLGVLLAAGLLVWLQLGWPARLVALASLPLVAAYPLMKRITWWPQVWLGLVFAWGALVGWVEVGGARWDVLAALYLGTVLWVVGYDTVYALQDREDDALIGIRSSARRLGRRVRAGVAVLYAGALSAWAAAILLLRQDWVALLALFPAAAHLGWQVFRLRPNAPEGALHLFRSNRTTGALVAAACLVVGNA
ncbi:4-hydroxybenzoate octaprenyltransferase [Qipengyuania thermophila]|uniref:4-hydroxybenzoate octaprenyltransferase n=1 Tax=Qipengyuania thermophila TaxID=2509361 RepID=UPI001F3319DC|nr:4-hydroxybenzoate octaprenyltransferase [Qipengyuania thermophila]